MKPHPRVRKTIKWGGAVVTVLLLLVWFGSLCYNSPNYFVRWLGPCGPASPKTLFPLWVPCIFALATIVASRLDTLARRRARLNLCPK